MDIGRVSRLETTLHRKVTVQCSASREVFSLQMRRNSQTFVRTRQCRHTCVVFGMPKEAIRFGAVERVLPLDDLSQAILQA
jgi:chemotaxis response regulator CheB